MERSKNNFWWYVKVSSLAVYLFFNLIFLVGFFYQEMGLAAYLMLGFLLASCYIAGYLFWQLILPVIQSVTIEPDSKKSQTKPITVWRIRQDLEGKNRKYTLVVFELMDEYGQIHQTYKFETAAGETLLTDPDDDDSKALWRTFNYNQRVSQSGETLH